MRLRDAYGFRYRFSMQNFVELASHLADPPSAKVGDPFRKYQTAFQHIHQLFEGVLPSAESALMQGVGLDEHTNPNWIANGYSIASQVQMIVEAGSLQELHKAGVDPTHYKKLRNIDGTSFLGLIKDARKMIKNPLKDGEAGGRFLERFQ